MGWGACAGTTVAGPRASEDAALSWGAQGPRGTGGRAPTDASLGHINSPSVSMPAAPHILVHDTWALGLPGWPRTLQPHPQAHEDC